METQKSDNKIIQKQPVLSPFTIAVLTIGAVMLVFYFIFDPMQSWFMPRCLFHELTGLQCMGCGSQRMIHALLHGDIISAFRANAFATASLPFLTFLMVLEIFRSRLPVLYAKVFTAKLIWSFAALLGIWFIVRNIMQI